MNDVAATLELLDEQAKACRWILAKTCGWGLAAAVVGMFGEDFLAGARPLFPMIDQNYALWQNGYILTLALIAVIWFAAVVQKINQHQEVRQRIRQLRQMEIERERRERLRAERAEERRLAAAAAAEARRKESRAAVVMSRPTKATTGGRFDY
ncbi:hypothetical protein ACLB1G_07795 [Oxalobacteraceae bacterium A2-2]